MSTIPPNALTSITQANLTQSQRAREADAAHDSDARQAQQADRKRAASRESVEDMAEAQGLRVDPDDRQDPKGRKRPKKPPEPSTDEPTPPASEDLSESDTRARSAALLADPRNERSNPPPLMLDIEA